MSRKAKEIQQRRQLILSVAQSLLSEKGMHGLTMQAIAERTDYSKGTIYQHFGCKEEVLCQLVLQCGYDLAQLMDGIIEQPICLREKIAQLSVVFLSHSQRQPEITGVIAAVKSPQFQAKLSHDFQVKVNEADDAVLSRIMVLFANSEEIQPEQAKTAAFGWWAMKWGLQDVLANGWELGRYGFDEPEVYFLSSLHVFLDGLGIVDHKPSRDINYLKEKAKTILDQVVNKNKDKQND